MGDISLQTPASSSCRRDLNRSFVEGTEQRHCNSSFASFATFCKKTQRMGSKQRQQRQIHPHSPLLPPRPPVQKFRGLERGTGRGIMCILVRALPLAGGLDPVGIQASSRGHLNPWLNKLTGPESGAFLSAVCLCSPRRIALRKNNRRGNAAAWPKRNPP